MTDRDDYKRLADELDGWHDCADGDVSAGNGHFRVVCESDSEQQRLNLRATLREAAETLRAASVKAGEVVAWRYRDPSRIAGSCWSYDNAEPEQSPSREIQPLYTAPTASVGAMREALEVLALFRAFVQRNVTRWELGAGDHHHHHPMWALIAETLGDLNRKEFNSGEGWKFIQPRNREALAANQSDGPAPQSQPVATDQLAGANTANGPSDTPPAPQAVEAVSVEEVAIKAAVLPIILQGFRDRLSGNEVTAQVVRALLAKFKMEGRQG